MPAAPRRGTTLIEVLAGLVILGTLLASVAIARGRFLRQWGQDDRKLKATRSVDAMLSDWMSGATGPAFGGRVLPAPAAGDLAGLPECIWRTRWVRDPAAAQLGARVVRLEVFDRSARPEPAIGPMLSIDLLVHDPARAGPAPAGAPPAGAAARRSSSPEAR